MTYRAQARTAGRRGPVVLAGVLLAVITAVAVTVGWRVPPPARTASPVGIVRGARTESALGEAGGALPGGVTVFDGTLPGVANLDPALLRALREAATDAAADGVKLYVNSGWRSPEYQERLLDEAISTYGSREKAARWVGTPTGSAHVHGDAVDIGHSDAEAWLSRHGARYGLYRIYRNEPWHFELRPDGRPRMYADPTQDPRMRQ